MRTRFLVPAALAATAVLTVVVRARVLVTKVPATYDEGVYGVSVLAMRHGARPFRDIFSSQGPLFLPILWVFDLIGFREVRAARLAMLAAALAITFGTYVLTRRLASPGVAVVAAAVTGTSATVWLAAGPVQADGIALAFALWSVVTAMGAAPVGRIPRTVVVGVLMGAAVALKSLFVVPAAMTVAWLYLARRDRRGLAAAAGVGMALVLLVSMPWGLGNVWDQYVQFHLDAPRRREPLRNLARIGETLWTREAGLLGFAAAALVGLATFRRRTAAPVAPAHRIAVVGWLAATVLVLLFGAEVGHGSERFVAFAFPPLVATIALLRPPLVLTIVAVFVAAPVHVAGNDDLFAVQQQISIHREVEARLDALPPDCLVATDRQGMVWLAGRRTPNELVDTSWARILAERVTVADVVAAADDPATCAVLFYSGRFDWMDPRLADRLHGYVLAEDWGDGKRLFVRTP